MRATCLQEIYKLAKKDKRVVFVGSDLGAGVLDNFKKEMPDRFFMEGVSEAHIIGMIAGMAMNGKIPYFNTIATFLTRRAYEQVFIDVAMDKLPVRLVGSGGGLVYAPLGPTHLSIEDIALMRLVPNMTVVAPADSVEMAKLMPETLNYPGPMYIRLGKGGDPIVTDKNSPFVIGRTVPIQKGKDVLIIPTGITLKLAIEANRELYQKGISAAILHMPTVKPLDIKAIIEYARPVSAIITVEEGVISGGLGSAVAEVIIESDLNFCRKFKRIGLPDGVPDKYGSQNSLMEYYNITSREIVRWVVKLTGKKEIISIYTK
jgi:transketolase